MRLAPLFFSTVFAYGDGGKGFKFFAFSALSRLPPRSGAGPWRPGTAPVSRAAHGNTDGKGLSVTGRSFAVGQPLQATVDPSASALVRFCAVPTDARRKILLVTELQHRLCRARRLISAPCSFNSSGEAIETRLIFVCLDVALRIVLLIRRLCFFFFLIIIIFFFFFRSCVGDR